MCVCVSVRERESEQATILPAAAAAIRFTLGSPRAAPVCTALDAGSSIKHRQGEEGEKEEEEVSNIWKFGCVVCLWGGMKVVVLVEGRLLRDCHVTHWVRVRQYWRCSTRQPPKCSR